MTHPFGETLLGFISQILAVSAIFLFQPSMPKKISQNNLAMYPFVVIDDDVFDFDVVYQDVTDFKVSFGVFLTYITGLLPRCR